MDMIRIIISLCYYLCLPLTLTWVNVLLVYAFSSLLVQT
jgi:hypothetical protein